MATSRTGTATWRKVRTRALNRARSAGQRTCPICQIELNWEQSRTPTSPEPDHIVPHTLGGTDTLDNLQVICRRCNQSKGHRVAPKPKTIQPHMPLRTSRQW